MRSGLLSNPLVIERVNHEFVCTWVVIDEARQLARSEIPLARTLAKNWEYPLDLMFLTSEGRFLSKLNSFRDLRNAHPDVGHPPEGRGSSRPHYEVFMERVDVVLNERRSASEIEKSDAAPPTAR